MERRTIRDASSDPVPFSGQWALTDPLAEARGVPRRTLNGAVLGAMDWMPRAWTDARLAVPDDRAAAARRAVVGGGPCRRCSRRSTIPTMASPLVSALGP